MGLLPLVQVPMCSAALKENRLFRPPDLPAGNKFGPQNRAWQPYSRAVLHVRISIFHCERSKTL